MMARVRRIEGWARLGYAARGLVYCVLGLAILLTGRGLSTGTAIELVGLLPGGVLWLAVLGLGMFGYGLFRAYEAIVDLERRGSSWPAQAARAGRALGGLGYWALAVVAARAMIAGPGADGSAEQATREAAIDVARQPGGDVLLIAAGLVALGVAAAQLRRAWRCDFWWLVAPDTPRSVRHLGRAGFAARGAILALFGWFAILGGWRNAREVRGLGGALDSLRGHYGLMVAVGGGLVLFGLYSLALARWRRIDDDGDVVERLRERWKLGNG